MKFQFFNFFLAVFVVAGFLLCGSISAQKKHVDSTKTTNINQLSSAEIIIRYQKYVANDQRRLIKIESRSAQLEREIEMLTKHYKNLDLNIEQNHSSIDDSLQEKQRAKVMNSLDLHLQSRQALQQQIIIIENKIAKQQGIVNYITIGQVFVRDDSVNTFLIQSDSIEKDIVISETQNRKELQAQDDLNRLKVDLMYAKQNVLYIDQLIRLNKEDLRLALALKQLSESQLKLYKSQSLTEGTNRSESEITRRIAEDDALISDLKIRMLNLEYFRKPAIEAVDEAVRKAESAESNLAFLKSSLAPHRIAYWIRFNLPKIGIILLAFVLLSISIRWIVRKILDKMIKRKIGLERTERLETLKVASSSIITIIAVFIAVLALLSEIGVDLTVVLGGAAVISLIIAFGAQSLVKDFFSGFMILFENQYRVGNVVKINNTIGTVENMSLRLTVLRDLEGISHFIPHGQILEVSNLTHGWSQVVFDIGVSYKENVDEVMKVITELCTEISTDKKFGPLIIGHMDMLGVDKFAESAIIVKFLVKTQPLKQWIIKRELLRRIKNRFDELDIEIPFPHLTIYQGDSKKQLENIQSSESEELGLK
jgi:small conductance mechanosensitive channel